MEYVEGEKLSDLLQKGPLPLNEALRIASEMAEALEEAHHHGIVHRDIKTSNIILTDQGHVKITDFGIAKKFRYRVDEEEDWTLTRKGESVSGTPDYKSPEQIRGDPVDQRSDLFQFGMVLYEMLSGVHPFRKAQPMETMGAILKDDPPPLTRYVEDLPDVLHHTIKKMLAKDARERFQSVHEVLTNMNRLREHSGRVRMVAGERARAIPSWMWPALFIVGTALIVLGLALGVGVSYLLTSPTADDPSQLGRIKAELMINTVELASGFAVSPDGLNVVYKKWPERENAPLYLRSLRDGVEMPIAGTENAFSFAIESPAFSPDGDWLAFEKEGKLRKVPVKGGAVEVLCDAPDYPSPTWGPDGAIIFAEMLNGSLRRVSESGGQPELLGNFNALYPEFLPDGSGVLFGVSHGYHTLSLALLDLASGEYQTLLRGVSRAVYARTGHLIFNRKDILYAVRFDLSTHSIQGGEFPVGQDIKYNNWDNQGFWDLSKSGVLVYQTGPIQPCRLVLADFTGLVVETVPAPPGNYLVARFSPDGVRIAVAVVDGGTNSIWVVDRQSGRMTQLPVEGNAVMPIWTPDGESLTYSSDQTGPGDWKTYMQPADGSGSAKLLVDPRQVGLKGFLALEWSRDGQFLVGNGDKVSQGGSATAGVYYLSREDPSSLIPLNPPQVAVSQAGISLSPDGKWAAYSEWDPMGDSQIYVTAFPEGGRRWPISKGFAVTPRWSPDGQKLYFGSKTTDVYSVAVRTEPFLAEEPQLVFQKPVSEFSIGHGYAWLWTSHWDLSPDGRTILRMRWLDRNREWEPPAHFRFNTGFFAELEEKTKRD
jgi:serine/threonine-protein kinase